MAKIMNHIGFFSAVVRGEIELTNQDDATLFASWKVGGQDFYIYGTKKAEISEAFTALGTVQQDVVGSCDHEYDPLVLGYFCVKCGRSGNTPLK